MYLFSEEEMYEEIDFKKIKRIFSEIVSPYSSSDDCDLIVLIDSLVELEKSIIAKRGKNKNSTEESILNSISMFYSEMITDVEFDYEDLNESLVFNTKNKKLKQAHAISLKIFNFIKMILESNLEKDNFSSKRKGHAVELFCCLLREYEVKDEFNIFRNVLNSNKDVLLIQTFKELVSYIDESEQEMPKDIIQLLYKIIEKAKNRSVVFGCLNVLTSLEEESEGSAFMIMDDWKEKNSGYR